MGSDDQIMTRSSLEALPTSGLPRSCLRSAEAMFLNASKGVDRVNTAIRLTVALWQWSEGVEMMFLELETQWKEKQRGLR